MDSCFSVVERLKNDGVIDLFKGLMLKHGALGYGVEDAISLSELERFKIIPLVFALMPESAIRGRKYDLKIKPIIRDHLDELYIKYDETLLSVIKSLCDQFFQTSNNYDHNSIKKYQISNIRATRPMFNKITDRQCGRCNVCGVKFDAINFETLDHVIPWRLIGDVKDGSNWQFLCARCNSSKSSNLSFLQMPEIMNWSYVSSEKDGLLTNRIRYAVLCRDQKCKHPNCENSFKNSQLEVLKIGKGTSYLYEFLETRCIDHLTLA